MTLDPEDWSAVQALGRRMVDDMLDYQRTAREQRAWRPMPDDVRDRLRSPLPVKGASLEEVYESFLTDIAAYPTGNIHPRFWGWVMGTGTVTGMLAEMLAAGMNAHVAGYDQSASVVERQVLDWLKLSLGFPETASGVLVSGGTAANLNGLLAARAAKAGWDVRAQGLHAGPPLTVYGSSETHGWAAKACDTMGMGRDAFRKVPVDDAFRIDLGAARDMIGADIAAGFRPIAIIGNTGTVNTAAIDDLLGIRALADAFNIWFHVDGAFGSLAAWSPSRDLVAGQESADSIAFDLHKWGYMPYEVGVALTRDGEAQVKAFGAPTGSAAYLKSADRGIAVDTTYFADRGLQLSRGFRALKVWFSMKEQGLERLGAAIQTNIDQAKYLGELVVARPELELLAPVSLNAVCFRYRIRGWSDDALNRLNLDILTELQVRGVAVPSQTILSGRFAIRVCITNHRSEQHDFDALVEAVTEIGAELATGT